MRRPLWYALDAQHNPVAYDDPVEACRARSEATDRVDFTDLGKGLSVSTVFLGLDHNFHGSGPPILFETMVFDDLDEEGTLLRYATWDQAAAGHNGVVLEMMRVIKKRA